jgi:hypothetical protein
MPPCAYSFHSLLRCIVRENNSEIRVHAAMLPNFCSLASRLVGKLIIIISHVPKSVSKTLFFRFPESRNFHFCLTDSVSWEHIFRLPRQICEKYLRNITLLECSIFSASTLSSTDVTRQPAKSLLKPDTGTLTALLPLSLLFSAEGTQATAARARAHKDQKRFRHDPHPALFSAVFAVLLARDLQRMCRLFRSQRSC